MTMESAIFKFKRILAIGAHPDDVEFGCLGFLLRQPEGVEKHIYIGSAGSAGDPTTGLHRIEESKAACGHTHPASLSFRAKAGIESKDFGEIVNDLDKLVTGIQPDLILCLGPHDTHQEHRAIHDAALASARRSKASVLSYGILSNTLEFRPTLFVDISSVYDRKRKALASHLSQKDKYYMTEEYLEIFHSDKYASLHGVRYSESYEIVRLII